MLGAGQAGGGRSVSEPRYWVCYIAPPDVQTPQTQVSLRSLATSGGGSLGLAHDQAQGRIHDRAY